MFKLRRDEGLREQLGVQYCGSFPLQGNGRV